MRTWTIVYKKTNLLPTDRPFLAYWRHHICIVQFEPRQKLFLCSAFPADHMSMIELRQRDLSDITHWMELPRAPNNPQKTGDSRKANYGNYCSRKEPDEKEKSC